jgi:hypothetical protein
VDEMGFEPRLSHCERGAIPTELTPQLLSSKLNKNMRLDWLGSKVGTNSIAALDRLVSCGILPFVRTNHKEQQ